MQNTNFNQNSIEFNHLLSKNIRSLNSSYSLPRMYNLRDTDSLDSGALARSEAPYLRKIGNSSSRENLVMTSAYERTPSVQTLGVEEGRLVVRLRDMQPWFTVYFFDIGHPCYDQLTAVKTRSLLTSIT